MEGNADAVLGESTSAQAGTVQKHCKSCSRKNPKCGFPTDAKTCVECSDPDSARRQRRKADRYAKKAEKRAKKEEDRRGKKRCGGTHGKFCDETDFDPDATMCRPCKLRAKENASRNRALQKAKPEAGAGLFAARNESSEAAMPQVDAVACTVNADFDPNSFLVDASPVMDSSTAANPHAAGEQVLDAEIVVVMEYTPEGTGEQEDTNVDALADRLRQFDLESMIGTVTPIDPMESVGAKIPAKCQWGAAVSRSQSVGRKCLQCQNSFPKVSYSKKQWSKRAGASRCKDCIDRSQTSSVPARNETTVIVADERLTWPDGGCTHEGQCTAMQHDSCTGRWISVSNAWEGSPDWTEVPEITRELTELDPLRWPSGEWRDHPAIGDWWKCTIGETWHQLLRCVRASADLKSCHRYCDELSSFDGFHFLPHDSCFTHGQGCGCCGDITFYTLAVGQCYTDLPGPFIDLAVRTWLMVLLNVNSCSSIIDVEHVTDRGGCTWGPLPKSEQARWAESFVAFAKPLKQWIDQQCVCERTCL